MSIPCKGALVGVYVRQRVSFCFQDLQQDSTGYLPIHTAANFPVILICLVFFAVVVLAVNSFSFSCCILQGAALGLLLLLLLRCCSCCCCVAVMLLSVASEGNPLQCSTLFDMQLTDACDATASASASATGCSTACAALSVIALPFHVARLV